MKAPARVRVLILGTHEASVKTNHTAVEQYGRRRTQMFCYPSQHLFFRYVALFPLLLRWEKDEIVLSASFLLRQMDGGRLRVGHVDVVYRFFLKFVCFFLAAIPSKLIEQTNKNCLGAVDVKRAYNKERMLRCHTICTLVFSHCFLWGTYWSLFLPLNKKKNKVNVTFYLIILIFFMAISRCQNCET